MIEILQTFDTKKLLNFYESIYDNIKWKDFIKCKQASLQYKKDEDSEFSGLGKGNGTDLEYSICNPFYKNTVFEEIINDFKLHRTRLMLVEPWSCYSMHRDTSPRVHIPLITNPECYFVFKDSGLVQHLPVGNVYWVDTTKHHTFINCSAEQRLHLMGSVEN